MQTLSIQHGTLVTMDQYRRVLGDSWVHVQDGRIGNALRLKRRQREALRGMRLAFADRRTTTPRHSQPMYHVDVIRIPCRSPGDTTGLAGLIDSGRVAATDIVAVMGKTEGNGCVNDYKYHWIARL